MPATWERVRTALGEIQKVEDVFAITNVSGAAPKTYWSKAGASYNQIAHGHAEYFLADAWQNYRPEEGEIVEIDITLKWSPCGWCAMRLANLKAQLSSAQRQCEARIEVFYLAEYNDKSGIDAWEVLSNAGIPCTPYELTPQGVLWGHEKHKWRGLV